MGPIQNESSFIFFVFHGCQSSSCFSSYYKVSPCLRALEQLLIFFSFLSCHSPLLSNFKNAYIYIFNIYMSSMTGLYIDWRGRSDTCLWEVSVWLWPEENKVTCCFLFSFSRKYVFSPYGAVLFCVVLCCFVFLANQYFWYPRVLVFYRGIRFIPNPSKMWYTVGCSVSCLSDRGAEC